MPGTAAEMSLPRESYFKDPCFTMLAWGDWLLDASGAIWRFWREEQDWWLAFLWTGDPDAPFDPDDGEGWLLAFEGFRMKDLARRARGWPGRTFALDARGQG